MVVTATKSGNETNFAHFGQYLAEAITDPHADLDKDGQISLLEAFLTASKGVDEHYRTRSQLATEHALLDDNGDQLGTPRPGFAAFAPPSAPKTAHRSTESGPTSSISFRAIASDRCLFESASAAMSSSNRSPP